MKPKDFDKKHTHDFHIPVEWHETDFGISGKRTTVIVLRCYCGEEARR